MNRRMRAAWVAAWTIALGCCVEGPNETAAEPTGASAAPVSEAAFVAAIAEEDRATVARALAQGVDPNARNRFGDNALAWAVNQGDADLAAELLRRGADPNATGSYGRAPLHWAARNGRSALATLLLDHGARVDAVDDKGRTALMDAAERDDAALVALLAKRGAALGAVDRRGRTALHHALEARANRAALALLETGAAVDLPDQSGETALELALRLDLDAWLLSGAVLEKRPELSSAVADALETRVVNADERPEFAPESIEKAIHRLVNQERAQRGLRALRYDPGLAAIARAHSRDMAENQFFNHVNLRGQDPSARAARAGYPLANPETGGYGVGENIYQGYTHEGVAVFIEAGERRVVYRWLTPEQAAREAVEGWMNSPGHRRNLLNAEYVQQGIGVAVDPETEKLFVTQNLQ